MNGRFFSERDNRFVRSINRELFDNVLQIEVTLYKISADATTTNIYGERSNSVPKTYFPGVNITCIANKEDIETNLSEFGVDRNQNVNFCFLEFALKKKNFYPDVGDLILYNSRYYQIDNCVREMMLGGIPEKSFNFICNSHYTSLSSADIVIRQT